MLRTDGTQKGTSEQRSDAHRHRAVSVTAVRTALGKSVRKPGPRGSPPCTYLSLSLQFPPRTQTLPDSRCSPRRSPGAQWGWGRAGPVTCTAIPAKPTPPQHPGHGSPRLLLSPPPSCAISNKECSYSTHFVSSPCPGTQQHRTARHSLECSPL